MKDTRSVAKRGTMSKQHWEDLRQAARLARTEGVTLTIARREDRPAESCEDAGLNV